MSGKKTKSRGVFDCVENEARLTKEEFESRLPGLRVDLINAQYDLKSAPLSVVIIVTGNDRLGCDNAVDHLHEWMDSRYLDNEVFLRRTEEEKEHPLFWRYWRALPPHGRVGIMRGAWARHPISARIRGVFDEVEFERYIDHVRNFERDLVGNGTLLLKFWLHISRKKLTKRLKGSKEGSLLSARLEEVDWQFRQNYEEGLALSERYVEDTGTPEAPWRILDSSSRRSCDFTIASIVRDALYARLERRDPPLVSEAMLPTPIDIPQAVESLDLTPALSRSQYVAALAKQQRRLVSLAQEARLKRVASVLVFEGVDAAGKGGVIRRITVPMAAQDYKVHPIAAPTDEEKSRHYLWRFWRRLPRAGRMAIFDRSWYGRVLVERVEGFAREEEWRRAYQEINDFEAQLVEGGIPVLKFYLVIDPEEQLRRFRAREKTPYKKYKITDEDYRNRARWEDYLLATDEMMARTSTELAPWHLISSQCKRWARVEVLKTVCKGLERALGKGRKKG